MKNIVSIFLGLSLFFASDAMAWTAKDLEAALHLYKNTNGEHWTNNKCWDPSEHTAQGCRERIVHKERGWRPGTIAANAVYTFGEFVGAALGVPVLGAATTSLGRLLRGIFGHEKTKVIYGAFDMCTMDGIKCDNYGNIIEINLANNNLTNQLPKEFFDRSAFKDLKKLDLSNNHLTGTLHKNFLMDLGYINYKYDGWGRCTPNVCLKVEYDKTGATEWYDGNNKIIYLKNRDIKCVKRGYGGGIKKKYYDNKYTEFSNPTYLMTEYQDNCRALTMPNHRHKVYHYPKYSEYSEPTKLKHYDIEYISVRGNQLQGDIPSVDEMLTHLSIPELRFLDFGDNKFDKVYSALNVSILNRIFPKLETLNLDNNNLTKIPELVKIKSLEKVELSNNKIDEFDGRWLANSTNLKLLYLKKNKLYGKLPDISTATNFRTIYLDDNNYEGKIPASYNNINFSLQNNWNLLKPNRNFYGFNSNNLNLALNTNKFKYHQDEYNDLLKISTNYRSWKNKDFWRNPDRTYYCTWYGVKCDENNNIVELNLDNNQITGKLHVAHLDQLKKLSLKGNNIAFTNDTINLNALEYLNLSGNRANISNFAIGDQQTSLKYLDLSNTGLEGIIPNNLYKNHNLKYLDLSNNKLTGGISDEIQNLQLLEILKLENNNLSDSIPESINNLKLATDINLSNNNLSGNFPQEITSLTSLTRLDLSNNQLRGTLTNIDYLTNLTHLALNNNHFRGNIPQYISNMENLKYLALNNNNLTGTIPNYIGGIGKLEYLALNNNSLSGHIDNLFQQTDKLKTLDLSHNKLSGNIESITNLKKATYINLSHNYFQGDILSQICSLRTEKLLLNNNFITGGIPECMAYIYGATKYCPERHLIDLPNPIIPRPIPNPNPIIPKPIPKPIPQPRPISPIGTIETGTIPIATTDTKKSAQVVTKGLTLIGDRDHVFQWCSNGMRRTWNDQVRFTKNVFINLDHNYLEGYIPYSIYVAKKVNSGFGISLKHNKALIDNANPAVFELQNHRKDSPNDISIPQDSNSDNNKKIDLTPIYMLLLE